MQNFKIVITGSAGTGKTSLARALGQKLNIEVIPENFESIVVSIKKMKKLREGFDPFYDACETWLNHREEIQKTKEKFIMDRCCFDILERYISNILDFNRTTKLLKECIEQSKNYDLVIVLPLTEWALKNSSPNEAGLNRTNNLSVKLREQSVTYGILNFACSCKKIFMPSKYQTLEERVSFIVNNLPKPIF